MNAREGVERLVIRRACGADLEAVCAIEQLSFPTPWSRALLASELDRKSVV